MQDEKVGLDPADSGLAGQLYCKLITPGRHTGLKVRPDLQGIGSEMRSQERWMMLPPDLGLRAVEVKFRDKAGSLQAFPVPSLHPNPSWAWFSEGQSCAPGVSGQQSVCIQEHASVGTCVCMYVCLSARH